MMSVMLYDSWVTFRFDGVTSDRLHDLLALRKARLPLAQWQKDGRVWVMPRRDDLLNELLRFAFEHFESSDVHITTALGKRREWILA